MLTTDGVLSFAVMNYAEIGLEEDEWYGWGIVGVYSRKTHTLHPNSNTPAIVHIADEPGNTGRLGQWVFRTDDINATTTTATTGTPTGGATATTYIHYCVVHCVCGKVWYKVTYECHAL